MPHDIRIPRLGWSMEEGTFVRWLKSPGETVAPGEPLFELEGEKSVEPVEAIDGGILHLPPDAPAEGSVVKVGTLVGWLLAAGETPPATAAAAPAPAAVPAPATAILPAPVPGPASTSPRTAAGPPGGPASPTIRRLARELAVELAAVAGSGPGGRIMADDVFAAALAGRGLAPGPAGRRPSTPRARASAARLGLDWRSLAGSGRGGRVREADVLAAAARGERPGAAPAPPSVMAARLAGLPKRRRSIAQRMLASREETAPVTLHSRADVTELVALRKRLKAAHADPLPAFTDLVAVAVAGVLARHPAMAGCWAPDGRLVLPGPADLHVGIAVDTEAGLVVPVVRDVGRRSLAEVAASSRELVARARAGSLTAADMEGGVFTVTNLGAFGIESFTPIINLPQTAILGLGAIRREPVATVPEGGGETVAIRDMMALSLTFDHCRVDGAPAARFLADLRAVLEAPQSLA
jgi:pyruvate dehydrogenase E2 component (dihydrolipoamide acetyltransferase)